MALLQALTDSGLLLVQLSLLLWLLQKVFVFVQRRAKRLSLGCKNPKTCPLPDGVALSLASRRRFQRYALHPGQGDLHKKFGHTFRTTNALSGDTIYSMQPENIRTVWSSGFKEWGVENPRLELLGPLCGKGFVTTDGELWKKTREALRPHFYGSTADAIDLDLLENHLQRLFLKIPRNGEALNLQPLWHDLAFDMAFVYLMGEEIKDVPGLENLSTTNIRQQMDYGMVGCRIRYSKGPLKVFHKDAKWQTALKDIREFTSAVMKRAIERKQALDERAHTSNDGKEYPESKLLIYTFMRRWPKRNDLSEGLIQYFVGASPAVAGFFTNAMHLLSLKPEAWNKLKLEASKLSGPSMKEDCKQRRLPYTMSVFNETLRMYPFTTLEARSAKHDTILPYGGGSDGQDPVLATKGTMFKANIWALHRDVSVFGPEPEAYNPDRWDEIKPDRWQFMPFGGGPRVCLGRDKARTEGLYVLARCAQTFDRIEGQARNADGQFSQECVVKVTWNEMI